MSENEIDDERGESYLEIQMDRSTIVLAAVGLLVLLAGAFLLGSWFGSRDRTGEDGARAAEASVAAESPEEHDGEPAGGVAEGDETDEVVAGETGFGGRPVSARGAPPMGAVPQPARGTAPAPGPRAGEILEEDAPARATAARASAPRATAARATAPKATATRATAASPAAATAAPAGAWIVQVAAVQDRAEADQLAAKLRKKGWPIRVVEEAGYVKVQVGPYDSQAAARSAETRLKREERLGTWVKRG